MAHIDRNAKYLERARELRKNMTRQEKRLWYDFLSTYPVRWYKQRIIYMYITDFYCSKAHLVIEIDGGQHYTEDGIEYDKERTKVLEQYDLEVIRFTNRDIDYHFDHVCAIIDHKVKENLLLFSK